MQKKYIYTVGVNDMSKIFITGIVASGKTTLARKISKQLGVYLMSDNYLEKDFERVNKKFKELMILVIGL